MTLQQYLQENYSPTAIVSYRHIIDRFLLFIGEKAATATYQDILDYISYLRKQGKHPKTIRNNLYGMKVYYRWLVKTGKREGHPCSHLYLKDKINRAIPTENLYTPEQLESFLKNHAYHPLKNHSPQKEQIGQRNKVIISLLVYQALTALEVTQLETGDVNLEKAEIFIKSTVNNKARTLPLKSSQILLLHRYITVARAQLNPKNQRLIINYKGGAIRRESIITSINQPGKERMSPLKIRQSVIAHLLKAGNDLRIVQVFAGHRSSASTEAYRQTGLEELKPVSTNYTPASKAQP